VYFLVWFCTFGGVGLRQVRQAAELAVLGATYFNNSAHFLADGSQFCFDVPQEDVVVGDTTVFTNFLPGVTPVCTVDVASINTVSLNVLSSFRFGDSFGSNGLGPTLVTIFVLACVLTLISSSDSSSLIVDSLSSNARKNYHWLRRLFWASTVGAVSMALLALAETSSMKVVEAFVAVCTLPMAIAVCFMFQSIILFCKAADSQNAIEGDAGTYEYRIPDQPEFAMPVYGGILNSIEYLVSFGKVNAARIELGMHRATTVHVVEFLKGVVVPFASLNQVLGQTYPQNPKTNAIVVAIYALCYLAWFGIFAASWTYPGATGLMWTFFAVNGCILSIVRSSFRKHYNLRSNAFADLTGSMFLWPQVLAQLRVQCAVGPAMGNNKRTEDNNKDEYIDEPRVDTGNRHEDNGNDEDEDAYA
jgi:BCCT, betaine/carnitine/choline family transporter